MEHNKASFSKRLGAYIIDFIIVYLLWYLITQNDLEKVNSIVKSLNPDSKEVLDIFAEGIIKLYILFIFKFVFVQTLYFTLLPSILGKGKTLGKLTFGISMLDIKTTNELSPSKLILREFVIRGLFESLLIIPMIVSLFMVIFKKKAIHDIWSGSIVVKNSSFSIDEYD